MRAPLKEDLISEKAGDMMLKFMCALGLVLALAACSAGATPLGQEQIVEVVWQALEPNTSSHNRAAWEVAGVQSVTGREVREMFEGEPVPGGCAPGPGPPANAEIAPGGSYWHVQMVPRAATPRPRPTGQHSPTAPPVVPEPFVYEAHFLVDGGTGQVVARKLHCVIY